MPRKGEEDLLATIDPAEKKVWTVNLQSGVRYKRNEHAEALADWKPVVLGDVITLKYTADVRELSISVKRKEDGSEVTRVVAAEVFSTCMPLHFITTLQPGNVVKYMRASERARALITLRALVQAGRAHPSDTVVPNKMMHWLTSAAPLWAVISTCLMIHDF